MLGLHVVDWNMTADILRQRLSGYLKRDYEADLRSEAEYKYLDRAVDLGNPEVLPGGCEARPVPPKHHIARMWSTPQATSNALGWQQPPRVPNSHCHSSIECSCQGGSQRGIWPECCTATPSFSSIIVSLIPIMLSMSQSRIWAFASIASNFNMRAW